MFFFNLRQMEKCNLRTECETRKNIALPTKNYLFTNNKRRKNTKAINPNKAS